MFEYQVVFAGPKPPAVSVSLIHAGDEDMLVVESVLKGYAGHQLGVQPGDVVTAINGKSVSGVSVRWDLVIAKMASTIQPQQQLRVFEKLKEIAEKMIAKDDAQCHTLYRHDLRPVLSVQGVRDFFYMLGFRVCRESNDFICPEVNLRVVKACLICLKEQIEPQHCTSRKDAKDDSQKESQPLSAREALVYWRAHDGVICTDSFSASFQRFEDGDAGLDKIPLRQTVLRWREMVNRSRDDLVCGFLKRHNTQCPDDVISVITQFYFADSDAKPPLLTACEYGYHRAARAMLETGKINKKKIFSRHIGSWNINTENKADGRMASWSRRDGSIRCDDCGGMTALHFAVMSGSTGLCELLLSCGSAVQKSDHHERTPLFFAAQEGHCEVAELLLQSGAYYEPSDSFSSLMTAAYHGHARLVDILLQSGADPLEQTHCGADRVYDAFGFAVDQGHYAIFKRLYEHAKAKYLNEVSHFQEYLNRVVLNRVVHQAKGWTLLHIACRGGHEEVVKFLVLTADADVFREDSEGKTAQQHATESENESLIAWLRMYISKHTV